MSFSVSFAIEVRTLEAPACAGSRLRAIAPVFAAFDARTRALRRSWRTQRGPRSGTGRLRRVRPARPGRAARAARAQRRMARPGDAALGRHAAWSRRRGLLLRAARRARRGWLGRSR